MVLRFCQRRLIAAAHLSSGSEEIKRKLNKAEAEKSYLFMAELLAHLRTRCCDLLEVFKAAIFVTNEIPPQYWTVAGWTSPLHRQ